MERAWAPAACAQGSSAPRLRRPADLRGMFALSPRTVQPSVPPRHLHALASESPWSRAGGSGRVGSGESLTPPPPRSRAGLSHGGWAASGGAGGDQIFRGHTAARPRRGRRAAQPRALRSADPGRPPASREPPRERGRAASRVPDSPLPQPAALARERWSVFPRSVPEAPRGPYCGEACPPGGPVHTLMLEGVRILASPADPPFLRQRRGCHADAKFL